MSVYRTSDIVGTSTVSFEDAVRAALQQAAKNIKGVCWFEVVEQRGTVANGAISEYQVRLSVGFHIGD